MRKLAWFLFDTTLLSKSPVSLTRVAIMETSRDGSLKILVVEDFADCAKTTASLLRHLGHSVRIAGNGPAALEACRGDRPDVVLLDIGLPGMSGYDFAESLRAEFGAATPPLVALTGYGQSSDRQRSADVGIDVHLVKPVDFNELKTVLGALPKTPGKPPADC
jgi:CheY-like chemotaxis protein